MSLLDLLQVQAGLESTWGTAVTATAKLMGVEEISFEPEVMASINKDIRQSLAPGYIATLGGVAAKGSLKGKCLYQDLPYWLDSLCGRVTPTGANPYTYTYAAPLTAVPTNPRAMTLLYGDSSGTYALLGALCNGLKITGENNAEWKIEADLFGKSIDTTRSLAVLSDRAVAVTMGNDTSLWIDAWGGTMGTTAITTTAFAFELALNPARKGRYYLGSTTAGNFQEGRWAAEDNVLTLKMEFNTTSKAYLDAALSTTALAQYQVRIRGTTGASAITTLNFAGTCMEPPKIFDDRDGYRTVELQLQGTYNTGLANWFTASVVNAVSALP